jgi:AcrR family transcriptional regulator
MLNKKDVKKEINMDFSNSPPQETRDKILYSALEIFSEKGYNTSSISEICKKAEITKGALYWHFKDKLDLYQQLIDVIIKGIIDEATVLIKDAGSPLERLRLFNKNMLYLIQTNEFYQKSLLMFLRELRSDRIADLHESIDVLDEQYNFRKVFQEALDAKEMADILTTNEYVDLYKSAMGSLTINWIVKGKKFDLCKVGERYFEYTFRLDLQKEKL